MSYKNRLYGFIRFVLHYCKSEKFSSGEIVQKIWDRASKIDDFPITTHQITKSLTIGFNRGMIDVPDYKPAIWLKMDKIPIICDTCNGYFMQLNYYYKTNRLYYCACKHCGAKIGFSKRVLKALGFEPLTKYQIDTYQNI